MMCNLKNREHTTFGCSWNTVFGVACWMLWRARNGHLFNTTTSRPSSLKMITDFIKNLSLTQSASVLLLKKQKTLNLIGWSPLPPLWAKLNTDGAYKGGFKVFVGGIIRNDIGGFLGGFMCHSFGYSAFYAEILGLYHGLLVCWQKGIRYIIIEYDSKSLVEQCNQDISRNTTGLLLTQRLWSLLRQSWHLQICHTHREDNRCADWLANRASNYDTGIYHLEQPPLDVSS